MARYKEIKEKIHHSYKDLPKNHKRIADYFVDNFDRIPFFTVHDVSKSTSVSVASIVRFAQRTGFNGFSELRDAIAESLQNQIHNKEIFPLFETQKAKDDILTSVANTDIKNINETLSEIDREQFANAINLISNSNRVFTAGLGISYLLAEILAYQLTQVGIDASVFRHTHSLFNEQIIYMKKNDILFTFSFPPYSKETVDAAKFASNRGLQVISITNRIASPITFFSKISLIVKSENMLFTNSFAAISVMINAIATACAMKNKRRASSILEETEKIMISQKHTL
jgi:DNA-binding MurR/RpiR family transcriptional regulator